MARRLLIAWLVLAAAVCGRGWAQGPQYEPGTDPGFKAWFDEIWMLAKERPGPERIRIKYELVDLRRPTDAELEALRESVKGFPQHPDRIKLAELERLRAEPMKVYRHELWLSPDAWRVCWDDEGLRRLDGTPGYFDRAVTTRAAWSITPQTLVKIDPKRGYPDGYNYDSEKTHTYMIFNGFATGGLAHSAAALCDWPRVELTDGRWTASASGRPEHAQYSVRASGTWLGDRRSATVDRVERGNSERQGDSPAFIGSGWVFNEAIGKRVVTLVKDIGPDGSPAQEYRLVEATRVGEADFAAAVEVPELDGVDPVRGPLTFRSVHDFASASPSVITTGDDGAMTVRPSPVIVAAKNYENLRWWGWWLAATLLAAVAILRVRAWMRVATPGRGR